MNKQTRNLHFTGTETLAETDNIVRAVQTMRDCGSPFEFTVSFGEQMSALCIQYVMAALDPIKATIDNPVVRGELNARRSEWDAAIEGFAVVSR